MPVSVNTMRVKDRFIMNEDTVNLSVYEFLRQAGFSSPSPLTGNQRGLDVEGEKNNWKVYVESKGSQANYHPPDLVFDGGQLWSHLNAQIVKLMGLMTLHPERVIYVMANPDVVRVRERVERIEVGIELLGIVQFWVQEDRSIIIEYPERLTSDLMKLGLIATSPSSDIV